MTSADKGIMQRLAQEMECPICFEYMMANIYQCMNSHNVCGSCNSKINKCPCCSLPITMRNRGLEKMAAELLYPCKYPDCDVVYPMDELIVHQSECQFGPFKCPMTCPFKGILDELLVHFFTKHENAFSYQTPGKPLVNTLLDVRSKSCWDQFVVAEGSVFFCSFVYSEDTFYGYVKLIGPPSTNSFVCEISLIGTDEKAAFTMKNEVHRYADLEDEILKTNNCLVLGKSMLQRYLDNRKRLKTTIILHSIIQQQPEDTEKYKKLGAIPKVKPEVKPKVKSKKPVISGSRKSKARK